MGAFFRPSRWKAGVLTLVMACMLMGGWVRSVHKTDSTLFAISNSSTLQLISQSATVTIRRFESTFPVKPVTGNVDQVLLLGVFPTIGTGQFLIVIEERTHPGFGMTPYKQTTNTWGIEFGILVQKNLITGEDLVRITVWKLPYSYVVVPLALLSGYLLLRKPRSIDRPAEPLNGA